MTNNSSSNNHQEQPEIRGWVDHSPDEPEIVALRDRLTKENGMPGLESFDQNDVEGIVRAFHRDGFVVIENFLHDDQIAQLKEACHSAIAEIVALDADGAGNRGSHRYSFGGCSRTRSRLHDPAWQMLLQIPQLDTLVSAVFASPDYTLRAASGDFCLPGAVDYQILHSDTSDWSDEPFRKFFSFIDPRGKMTVRDLPCPYIAVNFLPQDVTALNGPTRQIRGTQNSPLPIPTLEQEPEWMRLSTVCPAPAGSIMIRDVRAWHGGTPNLSDRVRAIPNLEFYAPWYREPMNPGISFADYQALSPRAQEIARYHVLDSSMELDTGAVMRTLPGASGKKK